METVSFRVQGSAQEPYTVRFVLRGPGNISAYCDCPAGSNGQFCKHRMRILKGSAEGVVSDNASQVEEVASWLPGTDVSAAIEDLENWEAQAEAAKRGIALAKKALTKVFMD